MSDEPQQPDQPADPTSDDTPGPSEPVEPVEPEVRAELLTLRDGLSAVIETEEALQAYCDALAAGTGPVAIDAERASGYRYSNRAYLIQLRREGAGTSLIDPIAFESLAPLQEALEGTEWILHAATQDLPCLNEIGLYPTALFDTELAGRLLGYPRVGLATLVETLLERRMKKEHSAVDWSTRPLPQSWLEYAALDVEVLVELRDLLAAELVETGKDDWARQEFDYLKSFELPARVDAWRRVSGLHRVRGRKALGAVRALWELRDSLAEQRDVTPGRILPDSAIVAAAQAMPLDRDALLSTKGFHGRGAERYSSRWVAALHEVDEMGEDELPTRAPRGDGPPLPRAWAEKDPVAARRLTLAREAMTALAEERNLPVENVLTPDFLRRTLWSPPSTRHGDELIDAVVSQLAGHGARGWQIALAAPVIVTAILQADADTMAALDAAAAASAASAETPAADDADADSTGLSAEPPAPS